MQAIEIAEPENWCVNLDFCSSKQESDTLHEQAHPYDGHLLKHVTSEWRKMARIVGAAIGELDGKQKDELRLGSVFPLDSLFAERLKNLAEGGRLEYHGDLAKMGLCELRLPLRTVNQS